MKRLIFELLITVFFLNVNYSQKVIFTVPFELKNNEEIISIDRAYKGPFVVTLKVKTESYLGDINQYCILTIDTTGKIKRSNNYDDILHWISLNKNEIAFRGVIGNKWYSVEGSRINGPYDYEKDKWTDGSINGSFDFFFSRNYEKLGNTKQMLYPFVKNDKFYVRKGEKIFGPYDTHKSSVLLPRFNFEVSNTNKIGFIALLNNDGYVISENEVFGPIGNPYTFRFANDNSTLIYGNVRYSNNEGSYICFGNKKGEKMEINSQVYQYTVPGKNITYVGKIKGKEYVYIDMEAVHGPYDEITDQEIQINNQRKVVFTGRIGKGDFAKYYIMLDNDKIGPLDEVTYVSKECKKNIIFITTNKDNNQTLYVGTKKFGPYDKINERSYNNFKDGIDLEKEAIKFVYTNNGSEYLYNGGKIEGPYDKIEIPWYCMDLNTYSYSFQNKQYIFINGKTIEIKGYGFFEYSYLNNDEVAYEYSENNKEWIYYKGKNYMQLDDYFEEENYGMYDKTNYDRDAREFDFIFQENNKSYMMLNDKVIGPFGYVIEIHKITKGKYFIISKELNTKKITVSINAETVTVCDSFLSYKISESKNDFIFKVKNGNKNIVYKNKQRIGMYDEVGHLEISDNGEHIAFAYKNAGEEGVQIDNFITTGFDFAKYEHYKINNSGILTSYIGTFLNQKTENAGSIVVYKNVICGGNEVKYNNKLGIFYYDKKSMKFILMLY